MTSRIERKFSALRGGPGILRILYDESEPVAGAAGLEPATLSLEGVVWILLLGSSAQNLADLKPASSMNATLIGREKRVAGPHGSLAIRSLAVE